MHFGPLEASRPRLISLRSSGLLTDRHGIDFDHVMELASKVANVPISLVSLIDEDRQVFVGACGLPAPYSVTRETPLSHSFCQHVVNLRRPLIISDARKDDLVSKNLAIKDLGVIAYLGFPVLGEGDHLYGAVCAIHSTPRQWSEEEIELMRGFAAIVSGMIEQHMGRRYQKLLTDVLLHDLKTPLERIQIAADLFAEKAGELPAPFNGVAKSLKRSADQATALVSSLGGKDRHGPRCEDLYATAEAVALQMRREAEKKGLSILVENPGARIALNCPDRVMMRVLQNLIANSIQFSDGGEVRIRIKRIGEAAILDVEDDGPGFQEVDYPKLFLRYAPLSAKPSNGEASAGLGLYIVKNLLESEGATIVLLSQPGESAAFRITAPVIRGE